MSKKTRHRRRRGRPKSEGTVLVRLRLSESAYDVYCREALKLQQDVRTVLRRTLTVEAARGELTAKEARTLALSLLRTADELDRQAVADPRISVP